MVTFSTDQFRSVMNVQKNIRNLVTLGNANQRAALKDSLLTKSGITVQATDTRKNERIITDKSPLYSLYHEVEKEELEFLKSEDYEAGQNGFLINMIESPIYCDYAPNVASSFGICDGALVIGNCMSGVNIESEYLLRQAVSDKIKPILALDYILSAIIELGLEKEEFYRAIFRNIKTTNVIISTHESEDGSMGDIFVNPAKGNVAFASFENGWAFSLRQFAKIYSSKLNMDLLETMQYFWGDHFYNSKEHKWNRSGGDGFERGFNLFVLDPIYKLIDAVMNYKKELVNDLLETFGINLSNEDKELEGKALLNIIMQKWLPSDDCLLEMISLHLPSPVTAQKYRTEFLYEGPSDDDVATAMKTCDVNGPLMMYVSKMIPTTAEGRFFAFGRVFSGIMATDLEVKIMGPNFELGRKKDSYLQNIERTIIVNGNYTDAIEDVPCGNLCCLVGVDEYLVRSGAITTYENAHNMRQMKFSSSPVVYVTVEPISPSDLPELLEGLKNLAKSVPLVHYRTEESGEHIIAADNVIHLQNCLDDLEMEYASIPLKISDQMVSYRETVISKSMTMCTSKSPNNMNRLHMKAVNIPDWLADNIENGEVNAIKDAQERIQFLNENYISDIIQENKFWCFGPELTDTNFLVDCSEGAQYLNEIKDDIMAGFRWATKQGVLCEETMRGVCFNLYDATVNADANHRGPDQIFSATTRCLFSSFLSADPYLMEPVYVADIQCHMDAIGGVYTTLQQKQAIIYEETEIVGTPTSSIKAYVPVTEGNGFIDKLRFETSNQAIANLYFDHWRQFEGKEESEFVINQIRSRKGLSANIPQRSDYDDPM